MNAKKNPTQEYTPDAQVQSMEVNMARMEVMLQQIAEGLKKVEKTVYDFGGKLESFDERIDKKYVSKEEFHDLKKSHQGLVRNLVGFIMVILSAIALGILALLGIKN